MASSGCDSAWSWWQGSDLNQEELQSDQDSLNRVANLEEDEEAYLKGTLPRAFTQVASRYLGAKVSSGLDKSTPNSNSQHKANSSLSTTNNSSRHKKIPKNNTN